MQTKDWLRPVLAAAVAVGFIAADAPRVPLIEAVRKGNAQAVRELLDRHADPNAVEPDGATALMWAAHNDNPEITSLLIKAGADVRKANRYGYTALALACTGGDAALIEMILKAGADANSALPEGETALMAAARTGKPDAVAALIRHGANVDAREKWRGQTALMWAAAEGNTATVKLLLKSGADLHVRAAPPPPRVNPYADPKVNGDAAGAGGGGAARRRSSAGDFTPFLFAVREGHIETVSVLLDAGADPNEAINDGQSALHIAAVNANYEIGVLLLNRGANPNAAACGWTPLHQVAWTRRPNIHKTPAAIGVGNVDSLAFTKALLSHGADLNARETKEPKDGNLGKLKRPGATAFLLAAKSSDYEYMRFLAGLDADTRLATNEHVTPLEAAAGVGIYRVAESPGSNEEAFESVKAAFEQAHGDPEYVDHIDDNGRTAMHGAAFRGSNEIVQFLYDHGAAATIDQKDHLGWTALTIAEGVMWPVVLKTELPTAQLLAKLGAHHEEVPEEIVMLGMATQGVDNGLDQTQGSGGFFDAPAMSRSAATLVGREPERFPTSAGDVTIAPIRHASVLLTAGGRHIYIDPAQGNYDGLPLADLILITDIHPDHLAADVIKKLTGPGTVVWAPTAVAEKVHVDVVIGNGETRQWGDWNVEAVPAYNRIRGPVALSVYHEKGRGNGYVLGFGGKRFYFSGDTEDLPEMASLQHIDAAFLCMNLPYTMTPEEAALAAQRFHPAVVYPYHYQGLNPTNLNSFVNYMKGTGIEVRLRDWYPSARP